MLEGTETKPSIDRHIHWDDSKSSEFQDIAGTAWMLTDGSIPDTRTPSTEENDEPRVNTFTS